MRAQIRILLIIALLGSSVRVLAQTIWVSGGASTGIGNNTTNSYVGVGTSTPVHHFHVTSSASPSTGIIVENTASGGRMYGIVSTQDGAFIGGGRFSFVDVGANAHRLTITSTGNVGVGTTSPGYALSLGSTLGRGIAVFESSGGANVYGMFAGGADTGGDPYRLRLFSNGSEALSATYEGNIGIGTATPSRRLEVSGPGSVYAKVTSTNSFDAALHFSAAGSDAYIGRLPTSGGGSGTLDFYNGGLRMVIAPTGNVGIGTTSPSHKLAVNGTVRAKEVVVDTGWTDHVFSEDYRLAPLHEVEAHILEKKHLPGIPSAVQVAAPGISAGEMQAKLLEKIEELTLHQIALVKEVEGLRQENSELRGLMKT